MPEPFEDEKSMDGFLINDMQRWVLGLIGDTA